MRNNITQLLFFLVTLLPGYDLNIVLDQVGS